jgi:acetyltransferase-like isoleucine patch superfamily enzyme
MEQKLINQRKITFTQKFKSYLLKIKYGKQLQMDGAIRVLGKMPIFKLPGTSKIVIGQKVVLNSDFNNSNTALTYRCKFACGLNGIIEVGDNTMINGGSITSYELVRIGKNCQIASGTFITDTDFHPVIPSERKRESMGYKIDHNIVNKKKVEIGDNVWIGWGAIILKGVNIGDNSIIAAGAVVVKDIPSNSIAAGNPAVVVKTI